MTAVPSTRVGTGAVVVIEADGASGIDGGRAGATHGRKGHSRGRETQSGTNRADGRWRGVAELEAVECGLISERPVEGIATRLCGSSPPVDVKCDHRGESGGLSIVVEEGLIAKHGWERGWVSRTIVHGEKGMGLGEVSQSGERLGVAERRELGTSAVFG